MGSRMMEHATVKEFSPTREAQSFAYAASKSAEFSGLLREYYLSPTIRERMWEFLGGLAEKAGAVYIVGHDGFSDFGRPLSLVSLRECLDAGMEVDRSLWDHNSLVADIDLEYHSFDYPVAPWLDPERAF